MQSAVSAQDIEPCANERLDRIITAIVTVVPFLLLGDPHSPHVDHGHGLRGALRGLAHAHVGWLFEHTQRAN